MSLILLDTEDAYVDWIKKNAVYEDAIGMIPQPRLTNRICIEAIKANPESLVYIKKPTEKMIYLALRLQPCVVYLFNNHRMFKSNRICKLILAFNGAYLHDVKHQTPELCLIAVKQCGYALQYVKKQTPEIIQAALEQDIKAGQFIDKDKFPEIYEKWLWMVN